jgi:hypothetical protein
VDVAERFDVFGQPYLTLTAEVIAKYLRGDLHIGLYPVSTAL